jgi:hypothetical protein
MRTAQAHGKIRHAFSPDENTLLDPDFDEESTMSDDREYINWTPEKLTAFRKAYQLHTDPNATFVFDDKEFVVAYAKYLIEYLEGRFNEPV